MSRRVSVFGSASSRAQRNQTFEVVCSCGAIVTGPREVHHQAVPCPNCGKPLFVLPMDSYAGAVPRRIHQPRASSDRNTSARKIDKLNRLAFWTRLRERRTSLGGRLCSLASRAGRWVKSRLPSVRG